MFSTIHSGRVIAAAAVMLAATGGVAGATRTTAPGEPIGSEEPAQSEPCTPEATNEPAATEAAGTTEPPAEPVIDPGDGGNYTPEIDPATFVDEVDNPYLPYSPGSRWVYKGNSEQGSELIEIEVLEHRRDIRGIPATVVRDTVSRDGAVIEDTYDWYAQDAAGNVWYLGEDTTSFECGVAVSTDGSWEYGRDGALPGIVMPAEPEPGLAYRQEYYAGEAEDLGRIEQTGVARTIGLGEYDDVVITTDWNPLEPEVVEQKWYARGVGLIYEEHIAGDDDTVELVEFTPAN
jgi:hypothetical protein